jgi:putative transposase
MLRAYKYRIYPTDEQKLLLAKTFGCCRFVYNWALNLKIEAYKQEKKSIGNVELINRMKSELKAAHEWLSEVNSQSLQSALRNLDTAYKNFFRDPHAVGFRNSRAAKASRVSSVRSIAVWTLSMEPFPYPRRKIFLPYCTAGSKVP